MRMIEVEGLRKDFQDKKRGTVHAVSGVSFAVGRGEIFGLLGPNGAGKTTTLRLLATILRPSGGTARIGGADLVQSPEKVRAQIGFTSGDMGHHARLTPREVLTFFGQLNSLNVAGLKTRVNKIIDRFQITSFANTKI